MSGVVWVSGASSGLGLYTARALSRRGWTVVSGARSFPEQGEAGGAAARLHLDVSREDSVRAFCEKALSLYGPPFALVNCAAVVVIGPASDYSDAELRRVMDVNFLGMAAMIRAAVPLMLEKGAGRIVNFSSVNGQLATPFSGAYAASKHAVEGFSEALAMELRPRGIQVMIVEPGDHRGGSGVYRTRSAVTSPAFREDCGRAAAVIARDERSGADPARLGEKVSRLLEKRRMPVRLYVGSPLNRLAILLHNAICSQTYLRLQSAYYGLAKGSPGKGHME